MADENKNNKKPEPPKPDQTIMAKIESSKAPIKKSPKAKRND